MNKYVQDLIGLLHLMVTYKITKLKVRRLWVFFSPFLFPPKKGRSFELAKIVIKDHAFQPGHPLRNQ